MRIGELAKAADSDVDTIRYYEKIGILPKPARTEVNYRHYSEEHADRLRFVRHCRALDMTLDEIRVLLRFRDAPELNCGEVNQLLDEHIGHVATRIGELRRLESELKALRKQCANGQAGDECGILSGLDKAARQQIPRPTERTPAVHVHGTHQQVAGAYEPSRS